MVGSGSGVSSGSMTVVGVVRCWMGSRSMTGLMMSGDGDGRILEIGGPGMTHDGNSRTGVDWEGCN